MKHTFFYLKVMLLATVIAVGSGNVNAQNSACSNVWSNEITGTNPSADNPYITGDDYNSALIIVSGIGRGSGLNSSTFANGYRATNWVVANSISLTNYFEFTLTPKTGYKIDLTSFVYTGQGSSGPRNFAFRSSIDNFTTFTEIETFSYGTSTTNTRTIPLNLSNITYSIKFRLYGYYATSNSGMFSVNDFAFNGTVSSTTTYNITLDAGTGEIENGVLTSYPNVSYLCLPDAEHYCHDWTFIGWSETPVTEGQKPTLVPNPYVPEGVQTNITLYAVYKKIEGVTSNFYSLVKDSLDLIEGDYMLGAIQGSIAGKDNKIAAINSTYASSFLKYDLVTPIEEMLIPNTDSIVWTLSKITGTNHFTLLNKKSGKYLYVSNNGKGSGTANVQVNTHNLRCFIANSSQFTYNICGTTYKTYQLGCNFTSSNGYQAYYTGDANTGISLQIRFYQATLYSTNPECCRLTPELDATSYSDITPVSVEVSSAVTNITEIKNSGIDCEIIEFGFVYSSTNSNPKIGDAGVTKVPVTGDYETDFNTKIDGLTCGTTYYIRSYATNPFGVVVTKTGYGAVATFTTEKYNVTLKDRGTVIDTQNSTCSVTLPTLPTHSCPDWEFAGWSTSSIKEGQHPKLVSNPYPPEGEETNITLHAVYKKTKGVSSSNYYDLVDDIIEGDYVLGAFQGKTGKDNPIAAINLTYTNNYLKYKLVTPSEGILTATTDSIVWKLAIKTSNSFTLQNKLNNTYLYSSTNGTGTGSVNVQVAEATLLYSVANSVQSTYYIFGNLYHAACDFATNNGYKNYTSGNITGNVYDNIRFYRAAVYSSNPICCTTSPELDVTVIKTGDITPVSVPVSSAVTNLTNEDTDCAIIEFGFAYSSTNPNPKIGDAGVTKVSLTGDFETDFNKVIDGLTCGTTYYIRSYAINLFGETLPETGYGAVNTFTTETYNVKFYKEGEPYSKELEVCSVSLPSLPSKSDNACANWVFAGWSKTEVAEGSTPTFVSDPYLPTGTDTVISLYAVYKRDETKYLTNTEIVSLGLHYCTKMTCDLSDYFENGLTILSTSGNWTGLFARFTTSTVRHIEMRKNADGTHLASPTFSNFVSQIRIQTSACRNSTGSTISTGTSTIFYINSSSNNTAQPTSGDYGSGSPLIANGLVTINILPDKYPKSFKIYANDYSGISSIDVTLTTYSSNPSTYKVTFNNEGVIDVVTASDCEITLPVPEPFCENWEFAGWHTSPVSTEDNPPAYLTGTYTPTGDITLYAVYRKTNGTGVYSLLVDGSVKIVGDWQHLPSSPSSSSFTVYGPSNYILSPEIDYSSIISITTELAREGDYETNVHTLTVSDNNNYSIWGKNLDEITNLAVYPVKEYSITQFNDSLTGYGRLRFWAGGHYNNLNVLVHRITINYKNYTYNSLPNLLLPPTALTAVVVADCFTAKWTEVPGATGYKLYVYTKDAENPEYTYPVQYYNPKDVAGGTTLSALVNGIEYGKYYYVVKAVYANCVAAESDCILVDDISDCVSGNSNEIPVVTTFGSNGNDIETAQQTSSSVYVVGNTIFVNAQAGETIEIYNVLGQQLTSFIAQKGTNSITVPSGVLLVRISSEIVKVVVR